MGEAVDAPHVGEKTEYLNSFKFPFINDRILAYAKRFVVAIYGEIRSSKQIFSWGSDAHCCNS
jgi:hypothetical protein